MTSNKTTTDKTTAAKTEQYWMPHVTVATVIEQVRDGERHYLLVHEEDEGRLVYNQPAGHLEEGESLVAAAARETLEETGWSVAITDYLGLYRSIAPNGTTYLRHGFYGQLITHHPEQNLDVGIVEAVWLTYDAIRRREEHMRGPAVIRMIDNFRAGKRYPLSIINEPD